MPLTISPLPLRHQRATMLRLTNHHRTTYNTRVSLGLSKSLAALGLDYVDLYLVHWPLLMNPEGNDDKFPKLPSGERDIIRDPAKYHHTHTWAQMEALDKSQARAIGVANYSVRYIEELLKVAKVVPAANQIENHPALPQNDVVSLCKEKGIHIMAYSPLGSTGGPLFKEEVIVKVAEKHKVDPAVVLLSWHSKFPPPPKNNPPTAWVSSSSE